MVLPSPVPNSTMRSGLRSAMTSDDHEFMRLSAEAAPKRVEQDMALRLGDRLREGDEMAGGILHGEFAHAVEGGALGHDLLHVAGGREDGG